MKPTIVFGDIHGIGFWKWVVAEHPTDRIVFLGDYLDPYFYIPSSQLVANLRNIIDLKKERGDDVVLLLGNHDVHYFDNEAPNSTRRDEQIAYRAKQLFGENRHLFAFAFQDGNTIFTHAGISQQWFEQDFGGDINRNIADQLNNPANEQQRRAIYNIGYLRGGCDNYGGIVWADIKELTDPLHGYSQIVGHNRVKEITERTSTVPDTKIIFCDSLYNLNYLQITSDDQYIKRHLTA